MSQWMNGGVNECCTYCAIEQFLQLHNPPFLVVKPTQAIATEIPL